MMKRLLVIAALAALSPWSLSAQVEKQVEVTKAYVPRVADAAKLAIEPDMTDTVRMRPEIDYRITPLSLQRSLTTRPIRPATVTYWEFNRPMPLYLKVGAGYPLNSVVDLYVSSQNPSTGYVLGYVNHEGRYADIENDFGERRNALRMTNRVGVAAGSYFGRRVLEGEVLYDDRFYRRYASTFDDSKVNFGDASVALRFGDDFQDLSRVNFEVGLRGGLFMDRSDWSGKRGGESSLEARARVAKGFGRHSLSFGAGYERLAGSKRIDAYGQQLIRAALRYGYRGGVVGLEVGADYCHDRVEGLSDALPATGTGDYILPALRLDFNLGTEGLCPFVEADGSVEPGSFARLMRTNPYLAEPMTALRSEVTYNGRAGIGGSLFRRRLSYRAWVNLAVHDNHVYWYLDDTQLPQESLSGRSSGCFSFVQARQTVTSVGGEVEYRPLHELVLSLAVAGHFYNDETDYANGAPSFDGTFRIRYEGRKIAAWLGAGLEGRRSWSTRSLDGNLVTPFADLLPMPERGVRGTVTLPVGADLSLGIDWRLSSHAVIFAEGRNLLNRKLYRWPLYPDYGANCTVGVKLSF